MSRGPWTQRCPNGHTSVRCPPTRAYFYCQSCDAYFDGDPTDAREVDSFPLDDADERRIDIERPTQFH